MNDSVGTKLTIASHRYFAHLGVVVQLGFAALLLLCNADATAGEETSEPRWGIFGGDNKQVLQEAFTADVVFLGRGTGVRNPSKPYAPEECILELVIEEVYKGRRLPGEQVEVSIGLETRREPSTVIGNRYFVLARFNDYEATTTSLSADWPEVVEYQRFGEELRQFFQRELVEKGGMGVVGNRSFAPTELQQGFHHGSEFKEQTTIPYNERPLTSATVTALTSPLTGPGYRDRTFGINGRLPLPQKLNDTLPRLFCRRNGEIVAVDEDLAFWYNIAADGRTSTTTSMTRLEAEFRMFDLKLDVPTDKFYLQSDPELVRLDTTGNIDFDFAANGKFSLPVPGARKVAIVGDRAVFGINVGESPHYPEAFRIDSASLQNQHYSTGTQLLKTIEEAKQSEYLALLPAPNSTALAILEERTGRYEVAVPMQVDAEGSTTAYRQHGNLAEIGSFNGAVLAGEKLLLYGATWGGENPGQSELLLVMLGADGKRDKRFGTNGQLAHAFQSRSKPMGRGGRGPVRDIAHDVAVQPDGKLVVAAQLTYSPNRVAAVLRYLPNGELDMTFGLNGVAVIPTENNIAAASRVVLQPDGGIVVCITETLPRFTKVNWLIRLHD